MTPEYSRAAAWLISQFGFGQSERAAFRDAVIKSDKPEDLPLEYQRWLNAGDIPVKYKKDLWSSNE